MNHHSAIIPDYGILHKPGYDLGGKATIGINSRPARILQLSADRDGDPYTVAIGIDVKTIVPAAATSDHLLRGKLLFGSKGGRGEVLFDLRNGVRVTVEASYISLDAFMVGTPANVGEASFEVHSSVGQGTTNGPWSLAFSEPRFSLAAGATSAIFAIPSYARRVACYSNTSGTWVIETLATNAGGAPVLQQFNGTQNMEPVQIPNGAQFVQVRNTGGGGIVASLFYELTL